MSITPSRGNNPHGIATFDPMDHPEYRAAIRDISNRFQRLKRLPPISTTEERLLADGRIPSDREREERLDDGPRQK